MANTSARTLRILSLLQSRRFWPGEQLAEQLDVSVRTLRRDIDRLRELGYPVEARRGIDGGYELAPGASLPPLVLDDDEAVALAVGLHAAVRDGSVVGIEESSVRALAKVVQVMPTRLRRRVDSLAAMTVPSPWSDPDEAVDAGLLTTIAQACRDGIRLEFDYAARDGARTDRRVEPHRLVLLGRRWYLVAWDMLRSDWRSFRLDRLTGPRVTGSPFLARVLPADDAAAFVRAGIRSVPAELDVEVVVHAGAETVQTRIGRWATVEALDDERCRLRIATDAPEWVLMALGRVGAEFTIVGPPEMVDHARAWNDRLRRALDRAG